MNAPSPSRHRMLSPLAAFLLILAGLGFEPSPAANTTDANSITSTLLTPGAPLGGPVTITWSIVPDGTPMPSFGATTPNPASNLIARFDTLHNVPAGERDPDDLTKRPWFTAFRQLLNNFGRKTAINYAVVESFFVFLLTRDAGKRFVARSYEEILEGRDPLKALSEKDMDGMEGAWIRYIRDRLL